MGNRPNSYLGYGIAWEEGDHGDMDIYDIMDKLETHEDIYAELWAHEETPCLFLHIRETFKSNDWDGLGIINIEDVKPLPWAIRRKNWTNDLKQVCKDLNLNYKKPEFHLLSYYG